MEREARYAGSEPGTTAQGNLAAQGSGTGPGTSGRASAVSAFSRPDREAGGASEWVDLGQTVDMWLEDRSVMDLRGPAWDPRETAVVIVDMLLGFTRLGPLKSPRVDALTGPIARFLTALEGAGLRTAYRLEDAHTDHAGEFAVYPRHCLAGTEEAEPVPELLEIPLFRAAKRIAKNALSVQDRLDLEAIVFGLGIRKVILVGDCTDLCIAANALPLRFAANAREHDLTVTVPMDLVDTFDAPGHPADVMHRFALYHMGRNGIEVVRSGIL